MAEDDLTVDVARLMAPDVKTEPDGKQGKPNGHESIQVAEKTHLKPEAKWHLMKRAEFALTDAICDGKSKNETWTEHVEMLEDSFRDLEDSGCTLSEESKVGI